MGLAIEVVQSLDDTGELICSRFPASGDADLKMGAQVIVRESQSAVFFRGGKALDTFGPGRHTLTTANIPLLQQVMSIPFGGDTPFKAEVYYVNHKVFPNIKWGTREPIPFRDTELHLVRLRAFGIMSYKVEDAQVFVNTIVGTKGSFQADEINDFLKGIIIGRLTDFLGENLKSVFDLARYYDEIGSGTKSRLKDDFGKYGMSLEDFIINAITPPEEVQKRIDERSGMAALGMNDYMRYSAAQAMQNASKAEGGGGMAGTGMGAGMGLGMGMMMPGMFAQAMGPGMMMPGQQAPAAAAPAAAAPAPMVKCPACGTDNAQGAKFCANCGQKIPTPGACPKCGAANAPGARFCSECGGPMAAPKAKCPKCGAEMEAGTKFCSECGNKVE
ncbi:MAG: SPFH domain-containing protein [Deltaproteobacteria bacterium]|nr:SPFH domain-containing protein [Deltaproteobacteria bacterium]